MPLLETKGAASAQGFGGAGAGASGPVTYIEDVFSTYLYTGNGSTQTITNGIDLSGKGGLVWVKARSAAEDNALWAYNLFGDQYLKSNKTDAIVSSGLTYLSNGFRADAGFAYLNASSTTYASWTFREQPKFFDVLTYTGNGANRTISHNLGSVPGCIIVKCTSTTGNWVVYHRSVPSSLNGYLNTTDDFVFGPMITSPTSTQFSINTASAVNTNGATYVAYLFAHDAGGFGLSGTDNVISCGSFTGNTTVNLGYEPQWLLIKNYAGIDSWTIMDNMRGMPNPGNSVALLRPNTSGAEGVGQGAFPTATGFTTTGYSGLSCIYIAIRRGPMKVPTSGTSVFDADLLNGRGTITTGFPVDWSVYAYPQATGDRNAVTRLIGGSRYLIPNATTAEYDLGSNILLFDNNTGIYNDYNNINTVYWNFRRAPGFFDVVCYTGTGSNTTQTHNLGVVPELIIVKRRDTTGAWDTYSAAISNTEYLVVNTTAAKATGATRWNSTTPTSTVFSLGTSTTTNASGGTYVAYLFATVAGVSKVGSYTGTGTTLQVNCGFTAGARFVLIKRTDSTGDWYVWDSARGIVSGNDPYLLLNSTAAEVTNTDYVDTYSAGFEISSTAPAAINANGGTYIFLAIA